MCKLIEFRDRVMFFFLSRANSTARCRQCFVAEFFQVYIVFLVVAIFAKTVCYSPSNLLVRSAMCRTSATQQLSTCRKWYVHHSKHSIIILVTQPISITPVLSPARKASEKILPVKTITQGKSKPLVVVSIIILGHECTGRASLVSDRFPMCSSPISF